MCHYYETKLEGLVECEFGEGKKAANLQTFLS